MKIAKSINGFMVVIVLCAITISYCAFSAWIRGENVASSVFGGLLGCAMAIAGGLMISRA